MRQKYLIIIAESFIFYHKNSETKQARKNKEARDKIVVA